MSRRNYPTDIVEHIRAIVEAWKEIDPELQIGTLTLPELEAEMTQAGAIYTQLDSLEVQLIDLRNRRDAIGASLWDKAKRIRTGVKSIFGDDSSEYEMMGGTRISERKRPSKEQTSV